MTPHCQLLPRSVSSCGIALAIVTLALPVAARQANALVLPQRIVQATRPSADTTLSDSTSRKTAAARSSGSEVVPDDGSIGAPKNGNGPSTPKQKRAKRSSRRRAPSSARAASRPVSARAAWTSPHSASALTQDLQNMLLARTRSGEWGAIVVSLTRGDTLLAYNADAMLQPASTMKLFTSALALEHFGPDYTFSTGVLHDGSVGPDGTLSGNLYLRGVGDPSLCARYFPGESPMDALARQVVAAGVKRVRGDVVADATAFESRTVPDGWQTRYLGAAYAARVSALSLNENIVWVVVEPDGGKAAVSLEPATTTVPVESSVRVTGGSGGNISAFRRADGVIQVRGSIGRNSAPRKYSLVVDDPALFTAGALRAALQNAGVTVEGSVRSGATPDGASSVATIASPPLSRIVTSMNRESINLFAELLFRSAAHSVAPNEPGSAQTGLSVMRAFLSDKVGAPSSAVQASDGSGLSVLDRLTPRAMIDLLAYAHHTPWGATYHASLPVAGESETLKGRMRYTPAQGNLHAKTGTTNSVASLGGYVTARNGEILAFSFIYNGSDRWNAKTTMDQMGATMAEFVREPVAAPTAVTAP